MSRRDVVEEIVAYNAPLLSRDHRVLAEEGGRDLIAEGLSRKLGALAGGAFAFFRGTFHLMAADVLRARVPNAAPHAPEGLIVGDLHLDNFGAYRGASGALVFDVNDFDDVGFGPVDFDLKRLCTSALLVTELDAPARLEVADAVATAWAEGVVRLGGRFPVHAYDGEKAEAPVDQLLAEHGGRTLAQLLAKAAPDKGHRRFAPAGDPAKAVHVSAAWVKLVDASVREYRKSLEQLKADLHGKEWELCDVVYRFKGTGSLGRLRFQALLAHGDDRLIVEIKEARASALDQARAIPAGGQRARMQAASIRRLQGDPWPYVAGTHLGAASALARTIQPEEEKLASAELAGTPARLVAYARQCGEVLARLHARESAPMLLRDAWDPMEVAQQAVEFARGYAPIVEQDQADFVKARARISKALGIA